MVTLVLAGISSAAGFNNSLPSITAPTRVFGSVYQNTSGKTIIAYIGIAITGFAAAGQYTVTFKLGSTSTPANSIGLLTNSTITQYMGFTIIVPNGWYYEAVQAGGDRHRV